MRWFLVVLVALAGCLDLSPDHDLAPDHDPASSTEALADINSFLTKATTTDAANGWHRDPETGQRTDHEGHILDHQDERPMFVASPVYLNHLQAIEGRVDWHNLGNTLTVGEWLVHPDADFLLYEAIHGRIYEQDYDDGYVDGAAFRWTGSAQVEWAEGAQNTWRLTWAGKAAWSSTSYGSPVGACTDRAASTQPIDSTQAVLAAMDEPRFRDAVAALPEGELWLRLEFQARPYWDLAFDDFLRCPGPGDATWMVRWTDLDQISDGVPHTDVILHAESGEVLQVRGGRFAPPGQYQWTPLLSAEDLAVNVPTTAAWTFEVPADQVVLTVDIDARSPIAGLTLGDDDVYILTGPTGATYELRRFAWGWDVTVPFPIPGSWGLERQPGGAETTHAFRDVLARTAG